MEPDTAEWDGHVPALLDLLPLGPDGFRCRFNQPNFQKALYGGQLLGQAAAAAWRTGATGELHSLHAYFLRGGTGEAPVDFAVERMRDSRNSSSRRVVASQHGQAMFEMSCLFRHRASGYAHQSTPPDVPQPEDLESLVEIHRAEPGILNEFGDFLLKHAPVEVRPMSRDDLHRQPGPARRCYWFRLPCAAVIEDGQVQRILLAYLSDYWFSRVALVPHRPPVPDCNTFFASIDHAMWFYETPRTHEWMLYESESPVVSGDTGLAQGRIFDRAGRLLAVTSQEVILRERPVRLQP